MELPFITIPIGPDHAAAAGGQPVGVQGAGVDTTVGKALYGAVLQALGAKLKFC